MPTRVPFQQLHGEGGRFTQRNQGVMWTGLEVMANNINKRGNRLNATRRKAMERLATEMETYAKVNAPWQNRTGHARATLRATAIHNESQQTSTVWLAHGVPYGIWLEIMNGGQYAIVGPTIQAFSKRMYSTVKELESVGSYLDKIYGNTDDD